MSACRECGACPCYEHERKTIVSAPACACVACEFLRANGREIESGLELALDEVEDDEEREEALLTNEGFTEILRMIEAGEVRP